MQLADYLKANRIKRMDFAARIGVSPQMVTGWCNGSFWVSRETAQKIYDETNGEVTPTDLLLNNDEVAQ